MWTNPTLGVNLEGLPYNEKRPLLCFIRREIENSRLQDAIGKIQQPQLVRVHFDRDAWNGRSRPIYYRDREIIRVKADTISTQAWIDALRRSLDCYDKNGDPVLRQIMFYDKDTAQDKGISPVPYEMTPHLYFGSTLQLEAPATWDDVVIAGKQAERAGKTFEESWPAVAETLLIAMRRARQRLQPLYDFALERSSQH
jgi:hypothetical protein